MAAMEQEAVFDHTALDQLMAGLKASANDWAQTDVAARIAILDDIKTCLNAVAGEWVAAASEAKLIPDGSPLAGEEWISGPYALMMSINALMNTLGGIEGKKFLDALKVRELGNGQVAARVIPGSIWDRILLSGISADVWMQPGVTVQNLPAHTASAYDAPVAARKGAVALVLGAGNIAAIPPLDCLHKLFAEHQVVILKLNPVNEYLAPFLEAALKPLIDRGALAIVRGGADVGGYLANHADVDEIHITGSGASHDAIVWGAGDQGARNKKAGKRINDRRITSELGAVCPTIVVPGPWSAADLRYQAEHIATQKLHNSGYNCIACQMLILPGGWQHTPTLIDNVRDVMRTGFPRGAYYPGTETRLADFEGKSDAAVKFGRGQSPACIVVPLQGEQNEHYRDHEVFGPAMSTYEIAADQGAEAYLKAAIAYANDALAGTLGANILIHPRTLREIGHKRFESMVTDLHYGTIAVNAWTGVGFLLGQCPWGAFPGHTPQDVGSGIGFVHNACLFDRPERTVIRQPFRPYPRNMLSGGLTLLPRPPWFVTNRRQHRIGRLLTGFEYRRSWLKIPQIILNALRG